MSEVLAEAGGAHLVRCVKHSLRSESALAGWTIRLLGLFVLSIPFSIALAQTILGATTAVAARCWWVQGRPPVRTPLDWPIAFFFASAILAALVGLDPSQGLWGSRTYLQVVIVYLVVAHAATTERALHLVRFFLIGMIATSAHTVLSAVSPWPLPDPFPGQMTESGQLLFAIGLSASLWLHGVLWPRLLAYSLALHVAALVVNLKRGVWLATFATILLIGWMRSKRLILAALVIVSATIVLVPDVRLRIRNTVDDLYLPGNRYDIWMAAIDVIQRFPMGIGRKSGTILRDYPNIPANHKHAHNNFLQITMELGFLGLAAFTWWMAAFGWLAWRAWRHAPPDAPVERALALAIFATFVGFQIAGLVEYNFGDTEVLEVFFLMMGIAVAIASRTRRTDPRERSSRPVSRRRIPS